MRAYSAKEMEHHWRIMLLFIGCLGYLAFGSVIFSAIEGSYEDTTRVTLNNSINMFLDKHPTVPFDDLVELLRAIKHAADQSVTSDMILSNNNASTKWQRNEKPAHRNWDMANAFFFSATVVTTIGYGHRSPSTKLGRNICVLYAFIGIPFFGWLLAEIALLCRSKGRSMGEKIHNQVFKFIKAEKLSRTLTVLIMFGSVYSIIVLIPALLYSYIEGWDFSTAHYFCFISLSTIGFGDFVATDTYTEEWRWLYKIATVLYFVLGLATLAVVLNSIQKRQQRNVRKLKTAVGRRLSTANGNTEMPEHVTKAAEARNEQSEEEEEGVMMPNEVNGMETGGLILKESSL